MRSLIFCFIHAGSVVMLFGQATERAPPVSVCELLSHRNEYNGRVVLVRGIIEAGGHGAWLAAGSDCRYQFITRGVLWPNIIHLVYPDNQSKIASYHADFSVDWRSIENARKDVKRQGFNPRTDHIIETQEGLFVTYTDLESRVSSGIPGALRLGFGPLGEAPAQFLTKSVKHVVVVHGPPP